MAWVRVGDEALSHPKLMSLYDIEGAEDISIIEMFGFLMALATYSAKHLTDEGRGLPRRRALAGCAPHRCGGVCSAAYVG